MLKVGLTAFTGRGTAKARARGACIADERGPWGVVGGRVLARGTPNLWDDVIICSIDYICCCWMISLNKALSIVSIQQLVI